MKRDRTPDEDRLLSYHKVLGSAMFEKNMEIIVVLTYWDYNNPLEEATY